MKIKAVMTMEFDEDDAKLQIAWKFEPPPDEQMPLLRELAAIATGAIEEAMRQANQEPGRARFSPPIRHQPGHVMPIRPELRAYYRSKEWAAIRARIRERDGNRCNRCRVPNNIDVDRANGGWWLEVSFKPGLSGVVIKWRDEKYRHVKPKKYPKTRRVRIVLAVAHLDNDWSNDKEDNLALLCQWCHLNHDIPIHVVHSRETRIRRKDRDRGLLVIAEGMEARA